MSFAREEVEQEFEEAARLGRRNHHEQVAVYMERRWWWEVGFQKLRPVTTIQPIAPPKTWLCATCGATCELRLGTKNIVHLGPVKNCPRKTA